MKTKHFFRSMLSFLLVLSFVIPFNLLGGSASATSTVLVDDDFSGVSGTPLNATYNSRYTTVAGKAGTATIDTAASHEAGGTGLKLTGMSQTIVSGMQDNYQKEISFKVNFPDAGSSSGNNGIYIAAYQKAGNRFAKQNFYITPHNSTVGISTENDVSGDQQPTDPPLSGSATGTKVVTANTWYGVRARVESDNKLNVRVWNLAEEEPNTWVTTATLGGAPTIADHVIHIEANLGVGKSIYLDDLLVTTLQTYTTTPAVTNNSVKKSTTPTSVSYVLTTPNDGGLWEVFSAPLGKAKPANVSVAVSGTDLTLSTTAADLPAGTYFVAKTSTGLEASMRLALTVEEAGSSAVPSITSNSVQKTKFTQKTVEYNLDTPISGIWKVYTTSTGGVATGAITGTASDTTLTLTSTADFAPATYYVTVTEPGLAESTPRQPVTVTEAVVGDPAYTFLNETFDDYSLGDFTTSERYPIVAANRFKIATDTSVVGKVLSAKNPTGNVAQIFMNLPVTEKQVTFDFKMKSPMPTGHGGIYIAIYNDLNGNAGNRYQYSFNPSYGTKIMYSADYNGVAYDNQGSSSFTYTADQWYSTKAAYFDGRCFIKIWEKGTTEPTTWNVTGLANRFVPQSAGAKMRFEFAPVSASGDIYMDNLVIKTWEDLASRPKYAVTTASEPAGGGVLTGAKEYTELESATVTAAANSTYEFVNWTIDGVEVSSSTSYTFIVNKATTVKANFKRQVPEILSFMIEGQTKLPVINTSTKTVTVQLASDVNLATLRPYFYSKYRLNTSCKPYDVMDLTSGLATISFDGFPEATWTIVATQNTVMKRFFVNPTIGSDTNDGSLAAPFKSIKQAQLAVRALGKSWTGDVVIHLAAGKHLLAETITMDPSDSAPAGFSVIYQGASAEQTIVTSGKQVTGWTVDPNKAGAWVANAPEMPAGVTFSRDLYVNGVRAIPARNAPGRPAGYDDNDPNMEKTATGYNATGVWKDMYTYKNPTDIEFVYEKAWKYTIVPVASIVQDGDTSVVTMLNRPFKDASDIPWQPINDPNYIQNVYEFLDSEGEFYFDSVAQKIHYVPATGIDPNTLSIIMPKLDKLFDIHGVDANPVYGLTLKNIGFQYTSYLRPHLIGQPDLQAGYIIDPDMVQVHNHDNVVKTPSGLEASYVEGMRVSGCNFTQMSAGALDLDIGVAGSTVINNTFSSIGASAIQVGNARERDAHPEATVMYDKGVFKTGIAPDMGRVTHDIYVFSNSITDMGLVFKGSIGILVGYAQDVTLSHNTLKKASYSGISAGWGWGIWDQGGSASYRDNGNRYYVFDTPSIVERYVIEYNNISSTMQRLHDGGSIYTLGYMKDSIMRGNMMTDSPHFSGGIYFDEGSGGFEVISENMIGLDVGSAPGVNIVFYNSLTQKMNIEKERMMALTDSTYHGVAASTFPAAWVARAGTVAFAGNTVSQSETPSFTETTVSTASMSSVSFALNAPIDGSWAVYDADGVLHTTILARPNGNNIVLSADVDIPAGTYYVSVTEVNKTESSKVALTIEFIDPNQTPTPTATMNTVSKQTTIQSSISFTLTTAPTGTWSVYSAAIGGSALSEVTASLTGLTLTLTHASDIPVGTYYVAVTEDGKAESSRLALTVGAYSAPVTPGAGSGSDNSTTTPTPTPTPPTPTAELPTVAAVVETPSVAQVAAVAQAVTSVAEHAAVTGISVTAIAAPVTVHLPTSNHTAVSATIALPETVDLTKITTMARLNADGTLSPVPTKIEVINGKQVVVAILRNDSTLVPMNVVPNFKDIGQLSSGVSADIDRAAAMMIFDGVGDNKFQPNKPVTYAESTTAFLRTIGIPLDNSSPAVSGINQTKWYSDAMNTAVKEGLITNSTNPEGQLKRVDAASLMVDILASMKIKPTLTADEVNAALRNYKDDATLTVEQRTDMAICIKLGIYKGYNDGTMRPDATVLRSQMASLAVRLQNVILAK